MWFPLRVSDSLFSPPTFWSVPLLGWASGSLLTFCFSFLLFTPEVSLFPHPVILLLHACSLHFVVSTPAVATDPHLSEALCGRRDCERLHQGCISSLFNPFALTDLPLGFTPPEPELESLTFCLLFCSLTLGLKMPVTLSCGLHVINHPSVFTLYLCRTQGVGQC